MAETIGTFLELDDDAAGAESLSLRFSPSSVPLKQRWRNNGLSADFLADYVTTFFPRIPEDPAAEARRSEIRGAVNYIANELLENAMKYSSDAQGCPITIELRLDSDRLVFSETNMVSASQAAAFRAFIARLQQGEPGELYLRALEDSGNGGLGFLTMMNDYGASLAWRFRDGLGGDSIVTTQVRIDI